MRTGKPCSSGSGSPFIATASIASRSSVSAPAGCRRSSRRRRSAAPHRRPSETRLRPAGRRRRTPLQRALPISSPPTGLETQLSVIQRLGQLPADQVGVGQRQLPIDHAVDAQPPVLGLDRRHHDGGVDPVEVVVRRLPRRDALDPEVDAPGRRAGHGSAAAGGRLDVRGARSDEPARDADDAATDRHRRPSRTRRRSRDRAGARARSKASVRSSAGPRSADRPRPGAGRRARAVAGPDRGQREHRERHEDQQRPPGAAGQDAGAERRAREDQDDRHEERLVLVPHQVRSPARPPGRA